MPLALRTDVTFEVVLNSDEDQEPKPTFIYRHITGGEFETLMSMLTDIDTDASGVMKVYEAASMGLVGWRNMAGPLGDDIAYDPDCFKDIIGPTEIRELLEKSLKQFKPSEDDLKNSESPSLSEPESSAKSAAEAA